MTIRMGIVLHQHRPEVIDLAHRALRWCGDRVVGSLPSADAELIGHAELGVDEAEFGRDLDLCLSLGGDGTMLRTTHLCSRFDVPVLGVNAGQLGYLTHVEPDDLEDALDEWQAGTLDTEARMMIEIEFEGDEGTIRSEPGSRAAFALNEVVLERAEAGHTVAVDASIGGRRFTQYLADGVIVATPTGSTAYSLSAGGPIVEPDFEALVVTPVAAHTVFDRSMVVAPTTEVRLTVAGYRSGIVTVDGRQVGVLEPGASVTCRASTRRAMMLVRGDRDFHTVLKEKFGLTER